MTERALEVAWASGLFEGEGSIVLNHTRSGRSHARLTLTMSDQYAVERIHAIFGGTLRGPFPMLPSLKDYWAWQLNGWAAVEPVVAEMAPWLSPRRLARWGEVLARKPAARTFSPPCGRTRANSASGYQRHRKAGEPTCEPCNVARRDAELAMPSRSQQ